jgi:hypothetical protein
LAALAILLVGPLIRGEWHGRRGFWLLLIGFAIWSARKARSPRRLRVANGYREIDGVRAGDAANESAPPTPQPAAHAAPQRRR